MLPRIAAFDLETTAPDGLDARQPDQAIPVQAALCLIHDAADAAPAGAKPDLGAAVDVFTPAPYPQLVNPGCPISPESAAVHGITDDDVTDAEPEAVAVERLLSALSAAHQAGYTLSAANAHYDFTVLDRRIRAHRPDLAANLSNAVVLDPMVIDRWADKYRRGKRTLTDLAAFYRVPLADADAHDAGADATAAGLVAVRILQLAEYLTGGLLEYGDRDTLAEIADQLTTPERFETLANMTPAHLHAAQIVWRREWASNFQNWLRYDAPDGRRDPDAVVDGSWPLIPAPA